MIICDYFLRIYKNYANLWVINNVLTIKIQKNEKIRDFMTKELLGIRIIE